jgi:hypothetical protein
VALDERLLQQARAAHGDMAEAERQALVARAEYHTAIRRLHLAGGSLREIADALGLSHQRIQQVVDRSGGSWWRRAWRTRGRQRDAVCTWCGRPPSEVDKLVAGPNVYICDRCVRRAGQELARTPTAASPVGRRAMPRCSFCSRRGDQSRRVLPGDAASICTDCLQLCREFMQIDR